MSATPVVVDTHAIVWYFAQAQKISLAAFRAIDDALLAGEPVYISAISLIELRYLAEHGRVPQQAISDLIDASEDEDRTLIIVPVDTKVAQSLAAIPRQEIPDMPDRIIAATAAMLDLPLVTADEKIRKSRSLRTIW